MFKPKKTIPKLAAAGLLLTSAGCGDDSGSGGMGGTGGSLLDRLNAIPEVFCIQYQTCDPMYFAAEYASIAECIASYTTFTQEGIDNAGVPCAEAILDYYTCYADLACADLENSDTLCADEDAAVETECSEPDAGA